MKKLIIILLMMAGSAHAAPLLTGDPYCDEPLARASLSWYDFLVEPPQSAARTDAWASMLMWRFVYVLNQCDINRWNTTLPSAPPLTQEGAAAVRKAIKPQTFR